MIHYPLSTLLAVGADPIIVVSDSSSIDAVRTQLNKLAIGNTKLDFAVQSEPRGLADAVRAAEDHCERSAVCVMLGDNIFLDSIESPFFPRVVPKRAGATVLATSVDDARPFAVIEIDDDRPKSIVEKPENPRSNWIVPGFYCYDESVWERIEQLEPSSRGELEITDLNLSYLSDGQLDVIRIPDDVEWFDAGTPETLFEAGQAVFRRTQAGFPCGIP